jgi:hypothetical protein
VQVVGWLTGDRDATGLLGVFELTMASPCGHDLPTVLREKPQDLANLQRPSAASSS